VDDLPDEVYYSLTYEEVQTMLRRRSVEEAARIMEALPPVSEWHRLGKFALIMINALGDVADEKDSGWWLVADPDGQGLGAVVGCCFWNGPRWQWSGLAPGGGSYISTGWTEDSLRYCLEWCEDGTEHDAVMRAIDTSGLKLEGER
jgi:hypothetical protein